MNTTSFPPGFLNENRQAEIYGVAVLFLVLVTVAAVLRFCARRIGHVRRNWDDVFVVVGYVLFVALTGACIGTSIELIVVQSLKEAYYHSCSRYR